MKLTIRPTQDQEQLLEQLKEITRISTNSGALMEAARIVVQDHQGLKDRYSDLSNKYEQLMEILEEIREDEKRISELNYRIDDQNKTIDYAIKKHHEY